MLKEVVIKNKKLSLPTFFPDATRGVIRSVDNNSLVKAGIEGLIVNTYHLLSQPGASVLKDIGGIKNLMNWDKWIISDSGGFQLLSMIYQNPSFGNITKDGVNFRKGTKGEKNSYKFTPEKAIQTQFSISSDIMICLDDCPKPGATRQEVETCVERTVLWAKRCKEEFEKQVKDRKLTDEQRPLLFGVIQGEDFKDLREQCAKRLINIGFDGFGFGGWPLNEDGNFNEEILRFTADLMPNNLPKYALGVGHPHSVVKAYKMGFNIFDTVLPTRDARHKRLYVFTKDPRTVNFLNEEDFVEHFFPIREDYIRDSRPVSEYCDCELCTNYNRAYLNHLFKIDDSLSETLATIHNLRTYTLLMENIRKMDNDLIETTVKNISEAKKYSGIYKPTIYRITKQLSSRYSPKLLEVNVKKKLHQIWGAYLTQPNYEKIKSNLIADINKGVSVKTCLNGLLAIQSSTNERISYLDDYYKNIFSVTGIPNTIVEPACGFNSFTCFWMKEQDNNINYSGYDIDLNNINFVNDVYKILNTDIKAKVNPGDIFITKPEKADIYLLLKVVPLLEQQEKGSTLTYLQSLPCKSLVVSFPKKSISGKNNGMEDFYTDFFLKITSEEKWQITKLDFLNEIVFVAKK